MNRLLYAIARRPLALSFTRPAMQVFMMAFVWLAFLAWMRPLALPDEGRYVGVAWEMLRSGNWVTPTLDGLPFFHKPPLFYWITALALDVFGPSEWAARSASILAGSVTVTVVYVVMRDWLGSRSAGIAALVLATQPLFFGGAQFANLDMLVAACISVAVLLGATAALRLIDAKPYRSALAGAYGAAALGVLAKGLIGLVIPALVLTVWLGLTGHRRTILRLCWFPGIAMFLVMTAPWFVAAQLEHPEFLHYFFVVQQFQRFTGTGFNNVEPFWFYVPVLLILVLPWSIWLLPILLRWRPVSPPRSAALSLMWTWLAVVLVFFSIPQSKLVGYVLPALPPVAVLVAIVASPMLPASQAARRLWWVSVGLAACVCVAGVIGVTLTHPKSSRGLATQLASHRAAHERVAFIDEYAYDLPFYLRDNAPVVIVSNWDPAEIQHHDNWRKELADAGSFAPASAADRLIDDARFRSALCAGHITWVVANVEQVRQYPYLAAARLVATDESQALWHAEVSDARFKAALQCDSLMPQPPIK